MTELNLPTAAHPGVRAILGKVAADADREAIESLAALHSSLTGRLLKPARYGGLGHTIDEFIPMIYELAVVNSSLAWLAVMFNATAHQVATLPDDRADHLWDADPDALVTTGYAGQGDLTDGRLDGRWPSVIGAEYADWLLLPAHDGSACRVLVPRSAARIEPTEHLAALGAAGICDVTVAGHPVDRRLVVSDRADHTAAAGAAAVVVGSADGLWRRHVEQVRAQLTTSYRGDEVSDMAAAQVARAASDIDAAKLQIATSVASPGAPEIVTWAAHQAVTRARSAADRLLAHSRHPLNASDAVTRRWCDVHAGCRLAVPLLDRKQPPLR